jgi:aspartyl/asparaginyl beta-hydroxylase (cupin superfamily)
MIHTTDSEAQAGAEALRKGDARTAHGIFSRLAAAGRSDAFTLLGLAHACRALGDDAGKIAALDRLLATDPANVRALVLKGDHFHAAGEARSASAYYLAALKNAPAQPPWPADVAADLQRARQMYEQYSAQYQSYIVDRLKAQGFDSATSSRRFAQSLDIVLGKKRIYVQEPRYYYFPGLPQIQFYERADFPWLDAVERATDDIRRELQQVMEDPTAFAPYVQGDANRPRKTQAGMLNNPAWSAFYLCKNGDIVPSNAARCPKTLQALEGAPLARVANRSPSILFSLLKPGARIPPHNGLVNTRLICHLPLIVPGPCSFRVGNDVRQWAEGKAWAFDDTIEHEAWNATDRTRVILLFDVWRPELSAEERALVVSLFEAIDAHDGRKPEWEI